MLEFCIQDQCMLDGNGRVKLSAPLLRDFQRHNASEVVLFCLPERALGVYPPAVWEAMRGPRRAPDPLTMESVVHRRLLRQFGSRSTGVRLTNQGRITIPPAFREHAELKVNAPVMLIGCEHGVEIWSVCRWQDESALIDDHQMRKGAQQMRNDLGETGP